LPPTPKGRTNEIIGTRLNELPGEPSVTFSRSVSIYVSARAELRNSKSARNCLGLPACCLKIKAPGPWDLIAPIGFGRRPPIFAPPPWRLLASPLSHHLSSSDAAPAVVRQGGRLLFLLPDQSPPSDDGRFGVLCLVFPGPPPDTGSRDCPQGPPASHCPEAPHGVKFKIGTSLALDLDYLCPEVHLTPPCPGRWAPGVLPGDRGEYLRGRRWSLPPFSLGISWLASSPRRLWGLAWPRPWPEEFLSGDQRFRGASSWTAQPTASP